MLNYIKEHVFDSWRSPESEKTKIQPRNSQKPGKGWGKDRTSNLQNGSPENRNSPWKIPVKYKPSEFTRVRQIGRLDPDLYLSETNEDLYDIPLGHLGRVWFTLSYDEAYELLRVIVHKARNLRPPNYKSLRFSGATPTDILSLSLVTQSQTQDCRIRIFIEQSERKYHATTVKKQTNNPTFEETFSFQVPQHELNTKNIIFNVLSIDKSRRCEVIGSISYPLSVLNSFDGKWRPMRIGRDLQMCEQSEIAAKVMLMISLTYFPTTERITVGLFECQNLPLKVSGLPIGVYAKVIVCEGIHRKRLKMKRTETLENCESFNESFTFSKIHDPTNINLRIVLIQPGIFDKPVAFVVLGNEMVSKGNGVSHWNSMIENPEETITENHELQLIL